MNRTKLIPFLPLFLTLILLPVASGKPLDSAEAYGRYEGLEVYARVESYEGHLVVNVVVNGKPPYRLYIAFAGKVWNYTFKEDSFKAEIKHPDVGRHIVKIAVVDRLYRWVILEVAVELHQVDVKSDVYYSLIPLSLLVALLPEMLAYAPRKVRRKASVNAFAVSSAMTLGFTLLPRDLWYMGTSLLAYTTATTAVILLTAFLTNRKIMKNTLEYIFITSLLIAMTVYLANPLPLIVAGVGNAIWLLCVLLFPSEWRSLERMIKSVNVLYALFMMVAGFLVSIAVQVSSYLLEPSWGMVKALIINITLVANLIMALPILASLFTFARLYAVARRGKEAEMVIEELAGRP